MKYLVIGDAGSMHIYNFVKTVLLPRGYEVHLLTLSSKPVKKDFREEYRDMGVTVHAIAEKGYKNVEKTTRINRFLNVLRKLKLMKNVGKIDFCHVHSVYITALLMVLLNRKKIGHLVLSYWGGDIENTKKNVVRLREKCFEFADVITVTVKQTLNDFHEIYGNAYDEKLIVSRFATDGLNCINELSQKISRDECRQNYNIPKDKICITCGYSASHEQQQDLIIEKIGELDKELLKKIFVIVPMQYGRFNENYLKRVYEAKEAAEFDCAILEDYVPFEMSAQLAIATDIYLHLRKTDAFSNALKEHIYSKSLVIKGDWLRYIELEEMGASVISIPNFDSLTGVLSSCIKSIQPYQEIKLFNPIYEIYSKENVVKQWNKVIDTALGGDNIMRKMTMDETKKVELKILTDFADFCDKNNLKYCLAFGTLIGAIRHKGFIPWDDDVDVWMPRDDYEKLKELYVNRDYTLINPKDKIARHSFIKIVDNNTIKIESLVDYSNGNLGVDIDVFPIDGVPTNEKEYAVWQAKMKKIYRSYLFSVTKNGGSIKRRILFPIMKLLCDSKEKTLKKAEKLHSKYPFESCEYVGTHECYIDPLVLGIKKEWFDENIDWQFENRKFKVPRKYHEILTAYYGDYMQPPPPEECVSHHVNNSFWKE